MIKWKVFLTAALVAWIFLFAYGAPILPVVAGTGAMALVNYLRQRRARA